MRKLWGGLRRRRGATGVEYGLLLGLVGVVALGAIAAVGVSIADLFGDTDKELAVAMGDKAAFTLAPGTVEANGASLTIHVAVSLSRPTEDGAPASVAIATADGSAVAGTDYTAASQVLSFSGGVTQTVDFAVSATAPTVYGAPPREFIVQLSEPQNALLLQSSLTLTIPNLAQAPTLSFAEAGTLALTEGAAPATVAVQLSGPSAAPVTAALGLQFTGSPAASAEDLALSATSVTVPPGELSASVTLAAGADQDYEPAERAVLALSDVQGASLGDTASRTVTIADASGPPQAYLGAVPSAPVAEGDSVEVPVVLSGKSFETVTVPVTVTPGTADAGDFQVAGGAAQSLSFAAGETEKSVEIAITADDAFEQDEDFTVALASPAGASLGSPNAATVTVAANGSAPTVGFGNASASTLSEGGSGASFALQLSHATYMPVTVQLALSGVDASDVTLTAGGAAVALGSGSATLTVPAGQTSLALVLTAVADGIYEGPETAALVLSAPTDAALGSATGLSFGVADGDAAPTVGFSSAASVTVAEGESAGLTVRMLGTAAQAVTVPYTLSGASGRYGASPAGSVTIPAGEPEATITVSGTDNATHDGDAALTVTLQAPTSGGAVLSGNAAALTRTVTVTDNDAAPVFTIAANSGAAANAGSAVSFTVTRTGSTALAASIDWTVANGQAASDDFTGATSGTLTFQPADAATKTVTVQTAAPYNYRVARTFSVTLSNPVEAQRGSPGSANGQIAASGTATSCAQVHSVDATAPSGEYTVDPDGSGGSPALPVFCNMDVNGGGWTLVMKQAAHDGDTLIGTGPYFTAGTVLNDSSAGRSTADGNFVSAAYTRLSGSTLMLVAANESSVKTHGISGTAFAALSAAPTIYTDGDNSTTPDWFVKTTTYPYGSQIYSARFDFNFGEVYAASGDTSTIYCGARWGWAANENPNNSANGSHDACGGLGGYGAGYGSMWMNNDKGAWQPFTLYLYIK